MEKYKINCMFFFVLFSVALLHAQKDNTVQTKNEQQQDVEGFVIDNEHNYKMALSLTGGFVQDGFGGLLTVDYKFNTYDFIQVNFQGNFAEVAHEGGIEVPVQLYALNIGGFYDLLRKSDRTVAIAIGGGVSIGYETLKEETDTDYVLLVEDTLVYGAYVGIDVDVFIVPSVALNLKANEFYHINSEIGKFNPYVGLGIKLILF